MNHFPGTSSALSPQCSVTQKDIAERLKTTRATVSLALRNHHSISIEMRRRVQLVAQELGYRPNLLVSTLMTEMRLHHLVKQDISIGLLVPHASDMKLSEISSLGLTLRGVMGRAEEYSLKLDVLALDECGMTEQRMTKIISARNLPGMVIAPFPKPDTVLKLDFKRIAAVAIGHSILKPQLHSSLSHQAQCQTLAMDVLISRGKRRIGLAVPFIKHQSIDNNWIQAYFYYHEMVLEKPHPPLFLYDKKMESDQAGFKSAFLKWVHQVQPDAILGIEPREVDWLREAGIKVPGNIAWAHLSWRPAHAHTAGVDPKPRLIGARAVDLLVTQMHRNDSGIPDDPQVVMTEGKWVEGETVFPVKRVEKPSCVGTRIETNP